MNTWLNKHKFDIFGSLSFKNHFKDNIKQKSFRHTYILFQIQNGVSATDIAKNLDTSTEMIDKFYTANVQTDELIDRLTKINRLQIKAVS